MSPPLQSVATLTDADRVLAAEYVLGTLDPDERERVRARMAVDPAFAGAVRLWERRLSPLHELAVPVAPPLTLWPAIAADLRASRRAERLAPALGAPGQIGGVTRPPGAGAPRGARPAARAAAGPLAAVRRLFGLEAPPTRPAPRAAAPGAPPVAGRGKRPSPPAQLPPAAPVPPALRRPGGATLGDAIEDAVAAGLLPPSRAPAPVPPTPAAADPAPPAAAIPAPAPRPRPPPEPLAPPPAFIFLEPEPPPGPPAPEPAADAPALPAPGPSEPEPPPGVLDTAAGASAGAGGGDGSDRAPASGGLEAVPGAVVPSAASAPPAFSLVEPEPLGAATEPPASVAPEELKEPAFSHALELVPGGPEGPPAAPAIASLPLGSAPSFTGEAAPATPTSFVGEQERAAAPEASPGTAGAAPTADAPHTPPPFMFAEQEPAPGAPEAPGGFASGSGFGMEAVPPALSGGEPMPASGAAGMATQPDAGTAAEAPDLSPADATPHSGAPGEAASAWPAPGVDQHEAVASVPPLAGPAGLGAPEAVATDLPAPPPPVHVPPAAGAAPPAPHPVDAAETRLDQSAAPVPDISPLAPGMAGAAPDLGERAATGLDQSAPRTFHAPTDAPADQDAPATAEDAAPPAGAATSAPDLSDAEHALAPAGAPTSTAGMTSATSATPAPASAAGGGGPAPDAPASRVVGAPALPEAARPIPPAAPEAAAEAGAPSLLVDTPGGRATPTVPPGEGDALSGAVVPTPHVSELAGPRPAQEAAAEARQTTEAALAPEGGVAEAPSADPAAAARGEEAVPLPGWAAAVASGAVSALPETAAEPPPVTPPYAVRTGMAWRGAALALGVVVLLLGAFVIYREWFWPRDGQWVGVLQGEPLPAIAVRIDPDSGVMLVRSFAPAPADGEVNRLWVTVPGRGTHLVGTFSSGFAVRAPELGALGRGRLGAVELVVTRGPASAPPEPPQDGPDGNIVYRGRLAPE